MSQEKLVLMACGSFSPPTFMHLRMFEIARDYIQANTGMGTVIGGLVSPVHDAYGKKDLVAAHHRIAMLKLALRSSGWIKVSDWETQQAGWTRTRVSLQYHQDTINSYINTLTHENSPPWLPDDVLSNNIDEPDNFMEKLNGNLDNNFNNYSPAVKVKLLCGADLLESFSVPGLWADDDLENILGRHGLVVVSRSGSDPGRFIYESDMLYRHRRNIILVTNYVANEVSSTVIRRLVARGESAKYLTDDSVLTYVKQYGLYGALSTEYTIANELNYINNKKSPQDVIMTSPEEKNYKNIIISIRDPPSIIDETVTVKKPKKTNFLMPYSVTDSVSPIFDRQPKLAYVDEKRSPGKAMKVVSNPNAHTIKDEKVSQNENNYNSLDSYLTNDKDELYKRRVSEGNVEMLKTDAPIKKRCSTTTIRKWNKKGDVVKKSKSEVSKLCDKVRNVKLNTKDNGRNYKTRSCNDLVKLVLTKHGIHVISDTEAIV